MLLDQRKDIREGKWGEIEKRRMNEYRIGLKKMGDQGSWAVNELNNSSVSDILKVVRLC